MENFPTSQRLRAREPFPYENRRSEPEIQTEPPRNPAVPRETGAPGAPRNNPAVPGDPRLFPETPGGALGCSAPPKPWGAPRAGPAPPPWMCRNGGGGPARGAGWWRWVVLAPWLPGTFSCLLCFGPPAQRGQLCRRVTGAPVSHPRYRQCLEAVVQAAGSLASVSVGFEQRDALRDIVLDALHFLEEQKGRKAFEASLQDAVDVIRAKLSQLEPAPACVPPCGYQPAARVFQCATCRLVDCQFPLDCPVQDTRAREDEAVTLRCDAPFAVPRDLPVTWLFAKDVRTRDLSLFEELHGIAARTLSLTLQEPTSGTLACHRGVPSEPVIRKYFYLNVSERSVAAELALQARFGAVLRLPDGGTAPRRAAWLGLALALGSMVLVLLLVATWRCWSLPDPGDTRTSHGSGQQGPPGDPKFPDVP